MLSIFLAILQILFNSPQPVHAAALFQDCGVGGSLLSSGKAALNILPGVNLDAQSYACNTDLNCADVKSFGMSIGSPNPLDKACLPHKEFAGCGAAGNCTKKTDGNTICSTVVSLSDSKKYDLACLSQLDTPFDDKPADGCSKNEDCTVGTGNRQCVRVIVWDYTGKDSFVAAKRCVDIEKLPAKVLDADKGSCGSNAQCSNTQSCVQNTFEPSALQSYVCYGKQYVSTDTCATVADKCTINGKDGVCMNVLESGKKIKRCIDPIYIPNGPNAPSTQLCKKDADCKSQAGAKYCLINPITQKSQCFSQQNIFTDMSQLPKQLCSGKDCTCSLPGTKGCDPTGKESICAPYVDQPAISVCINFAGDGAALGTGAGTPTETPSHLKPDVAEQKFEAYAPKLEIDIPNLNFVSKVSAVDGPNGTKIFSIPYLASYINAAYKYAIGLGVLIAIIMMMYAGMRWMTAFGNTKAIDSAKTSVRNAALGLFLLTAAYSVLYIINPDLPKLQALQILAPKQEVFEMDNEDPALYNEQPTVGATNPSSDEVQKCLAGQFDPREYAKAKNYDDRTKPRMFVQDSNVGVKINWGGHPLWVNKASAPQFQAVVNEIKSKGIDLSKVWDSYSGGWAVKRTQNNSNLAKYKDVAFVDLPLGAISNHSYGSAFDLMPKTNTKLETKCASGKKYPCMDPVKRTIPDDVILAFLHNGCKWGGMFTGLKDRHHFDCVGSCGNYTLPADFKLPPNE